MNEIPEQRSTMRVLAKKLGLSTMTISRALRNASGVSSATRNRVVRAAKESGYRPDPALASLNAYRHHRRQHAPAETIVFVTNFATADAWKAIPSFRRYFIGAHRRASNLGYKLEPFWVGDSSLNSRRVSQILRGRGIRGIIVGPLAHGQTSLPLNWKLFSSVAVGRSLIAPLLTTVSINHFQTVELAWKKAWTCGYRRIGLILTEGEDSRTLGVLRASYLLQQLLSHEEKLPILMTTGVATASLKNWIELNRPDLVLSSEPLYYDCWQKVVTETGKQTRCLQLNVDPASTLAGVDQEHELVGEHAMALLHLKLLQREIGVPNRRDILLIDGVWKRGTGSDQLTRRNRSHVGRSL